MCCSAVSVTFLILFSFIKCQSEKLKVVGPEAPLVAVAGEDLILPCYIRPNTSAVDMTVEWLKLEESASLVHLYKDHQDRNERQIPAYSGRTALFKEELEKGITSLKLSALRVSDEGEYKCLVEYKSWYDDITVQVIVEVLGSHPVITMESYGNSGGINLVCESRGWKPEPDVLWLDRKGDILPAEHTQIHKDTEGFSVKGRITVHDYSDSNRYYCRLEQKHHTMETEVIINSHFFRTWNWAFGISLSSCFITAGMIVTMIMYYKKALELQENKQRAALELQRNKRKAELIKKTLFAVDVTLDLETAGLELILIDEKQVKHGGGQKMDLPNTPKRFDFSSVLGEQGFSTGRFYYEVQVRGKPEWTLGVVRENINRKMWVERNPQNGFWTLGLRKWNMYEAYDEEIKPLTLSEMVEKVGVFVDYEEGLVSFYNVDATSHICSFTDQSFNMKIYPYFSPRYDERGENKEPLIITPVAQVISASFAIIF